MPFSPLHNTHNVPPFRLKLSGILLGMAAGLGQVMPAQAAEAPPAAQNGQAAFSIAAGPLGEVLARFAAAAGVSLAFDGTTLSGTPSPGLQGRYTVHQGFARLLQGSGFEAFEKSPGSYGLRRLAVVEPTGEATLGTVAVTANQLGEVTEGTGSFTPGTIATATRLVLTPRETPQTISVVTREEMDDFKLTSIDDVMTHTPGVSTVTYDSERTEYYARGFAIQNFQYDGIPMLRNSSYSAGNTLSDMAIYDRVEVLKGATGLLTGTGDPGATINLIRKKPTRDFQGQASVSAGSWNTYRGMLDVSGPLNASGSVRGRVVGAYQAKESQMEGYERKTPVFYGIIEANLTDDTLLTVGADYQDNDPKRSSWGGVPIFNANGNFNEVSRSFNNGASWSSWKQHTRTGFTTLEHYFANDWVAKIQFNHQINGLDATLSGAASGNPDPATGNGVKAWIGRYEGETTSESLDAYASGPFELLGRKHEAVIGSTAVYRRWKVDSQRTDSVAVSDFYNWHGDIAEPDWGSLATTTTKTTTRERGLYASTRLSLRDDLKLILGSRLSAYDQGDVHKSGEVTPYVGAVYDLNRNYSVYGSYTSIFQPQSKQDEAGRYLDPLQGNNYEAGVKSEFFNRRLNASFAYFLLDQDNYGVDSGGETPAGGTAYRAIDGVRTRGFELEMSGALTPQWQLHGGVVHKISRQQGEKVGTLAPENEFLLSTTYRPARLPDLSVGGSARWQDSTWADVTNQNGDTVEYKIGGYWLFDTMLAYKINKQMTARLNVNNVLDKKYYTIFNWYSTYTWGEGRNTTLSLDYRF